MIGPSWSSILKLAKLSDLPQQQQQHAAATEYISHHRASGRAAADPFVPGNAAGPRSTSRTGWRLRAVRTEPYRRVAGSPGCSPETARNRFFRSK